MRGLCNQRNHHAPRATGCRGDTPSSRQAAWLATCGKVSGELDDRVKGRRVANDDKSVCRSRHRNVQLASRQVVSADDDAVLELLPFRQLPPRHHSALSATANNPRMVSHFANGCRNIGRAAITPALDCSPHLVPRLSSDDRRLESVGCVEHDCHTLGGFRLLCAVPSNQKWAEQEVTWKPGKEPPSIVACFAATPAGRLLKQSRTN